MGVEHILSREFTIAGIANADDRSDEQRPIRSFQSRAERGNYAVVLFTVG